MLSRGRRMLIVAALAAALLGARPSGAGAATIVASVGSAPTGQAMPDGFVGVSLEFKALHVYTGRDPAAVNPVLVSLLRGLAPGQAPWLRIGGNSADQTWWPMRGVIPPAPVNYALTTGWLRMTHALAGTLGAKLIMGVNLAANRPALAGAEARALIQGVGPQNIQALEIGNEPDLYASVPRYRDRRGHGFFARKRSYNLPAFIRDFRRWRAAMPSVGLAGPTVAELTWLSGLKRFMNAARGLRVVTIHRYPLRSCEHDPTAATYPSIPHLLDDASSSGVAQGIAPYVAQVHSRGLPLRVGEMNSASCSGRAGVSNTFASALWALDTLFNLAGVGVDGVNFHSLPKAAYELFTFTHRSSGWRAFVHPEYYGMLMFGQAFPPGARLLPVNVPGGSLKVWATSAPDGHTRVVVINKDTANPQDVQIQVPGAGSATLDWLRAPSAEATSGVTLGGQSFGAQTTTGVLPAPQTTPVTATFGSYPLTIPAASAVLLTQ